MLAYVHPFPAKLRYANEYKKTLYDKQTKMSTTRAGLTAKRLRTSINENCSLCELVVQQQQQQHPVCCLVDSKMKLIRSRYCP
jgi:hypothetical protein